MLWDLAGSEEFDSSAPATCAARQALIVCDLTQRNSLASLLKYAAQMRAVNPKAAVLIAANKQDLFDQHVLKQEEIAATAALGCRPAAASRAPRRGLASGATSGRSAGWPSA